MLEESVNLRKVVIDKTACIESMLEKHLAVCLSSMPGAGKKTAVRTLLEKHPEVNAVFCFSTNPRGRTIIILINDFQRRANGPPRREEKEWMCDDR